MTCSSIKAKSEVIYIRFFLKFLPQLLFDNLSLLKYNAIVLYG